MALAAYVGLLDALKPETCLGAIAIKWQCMHQKGMLINLVRFQHVQTEDGAAEQDESPNMAVPMTGPPSACSDASLAPRLAWLLKQHRRILRNLEGVNDRLCMPAGDQGSGPQAWPEDVIGSWKALEGGEEFQMGEQVGRLDANVGEVPGAAAARRDGRGPRSRVKGA